MQSDFELSCKIARDAIAVPVIPLDAIRYHAQQRPSKKSGRRRRGVVAAIVASLSIVAAGAAAAEVFGHAQVSLNPSGTVDLSFDGGERFRGPLRNPKQQDLEKAARALNFAAILPKGLPKGTDMEGVMVLGPGALQIAYNLPGAWRRSNHLLFVILANPKSVVPKPAKPPKTKFSMEFGQTTGAGGVRWMVGEEEVIVLKSTITPAELAHFKSVMMAQPRSAR